MYQFDRGEELVHFDFFEFGTMCYDDNDQYILAFNLVSAIIGD